MAKTGPAGLAPTPMYIKIFPSIFTYQGLGMKLGLCESRVQPARASQQETVWWTKSNFLGLFPKMVEDQSDCEIGNYYVALPYNIQIYSSPFKYMYFFLIWFSEYSCLLWVGFLQDILNVARLHCR